MKTIYNYLNNKGGAKNAKIMITAFFLFFLASTALAREGKDLPKEIDIQNPFISEWSDARISNMDSDSWVEGVQIVVTEEEELEEESPELRAGSTENNGKGDPSKMPVGNGLGVVLILAGLYFVKLRMKI